MKYILDEKFLLEEEEATTPTTPIKWDAEFKAINTAAALDAFWKKFFKKTFKDKDEATQELIRKTYGTIFSIANKQLGWTAEENPLIRFFITYLDEILKKDNNYTVTYFTRLLEAEQQGLIDLEELTKEDNRSHIIWNKNFRSLDSATMQGWLKLYKDAKDHGNAIKTKLGTTDVQMVFANIYAVEGSVNPPITAVANPNTCQLVDLKRGKIKLSRATGKDFTAKAELTDKEVEAIIAKRSPAEIAQYFYYCYDIWTATHGEAFLKALGEPIAKALTAFSATQTKVVPTEVKRNCRADFSFDKKAALDTKKACTTLYAMAKKAGYKDLPELPSSEAAAT